MPYLTHFYGFYNLWELRHKVTFDGVNKLILVNDGETSIDAQIDLYSDWKEWTRELDYMKFLAPFSTVGGDPTIEGQRLDVTYFLINGWKIKPYPGSYTLNIVGNIFDVDGGSTTVPADIVTNIANNITVNTNTSVIVRQLTPQVTVSGSGLSESELATLNTINTTTQDTNTVVYDISGSLVEVQSLLRSPVTASLVDAQQQALFDIQDKVIQLWTLQGLDVSNPLNVTLTSRTAGSISQSISTVDGDNPSTTVTRQ